MPDVKQKTFKLDGKEYYAYNFPRPSVAVDCVIFGISPKVYFTTNSVCVLLIKRKNPPYQNNWALPGGFMNIDETSISAAQRELSEETGVQIKKEELNFVGVFDNPERDPRGRIVGIAYSTVIKQDSVVLKANDDATDAKWFKVVDKGNMAFDHKLIIEKAWHQMHAFNQARKYAK